MQFHRPLITSGVLTARPLTAQLFSHFVDTFLMIVESESRGQAFATTGNVAHQEWPVRHMGNVVTADCPLSAGGVLTARPITLIFVSLQMHSH